MHHSIFILSRCFLRISIIVMFFTQVSVLSHGAEVTWLGGVGDWSDPDKWDTGQVPQTGDDVTIGMGDTVQIDVNTNILNHLSISPNSEVTVRFNRSLKLESTVDADNQAIIVAGTLINNGTVDILSLIDLSTASNTCGLWILPTGEFKNMRTCNIQFVQGGDGIINAGVLLNEGILYISDIDGGYGLVNLGYTEIGVAGILDIATVNSAVTGAAVWINNGSLVNYNLVKILDSNNHGFNIVSGTVSNYDSIIVTECQQIGIRNYDTIENHPGSYLSVNDCDIGILNNDFFRNQGICEVGQHSDAGVLNQDLWLNEHVLEISGSTDAGFVNSDTLDNSGVVKISGVKGTTGSSFKINNPSLVTNSGLIEISDRGSVDGLTILGTLTNESIGEIRIIDLAASTDPLIIEQGAVFNNYGILDVQK